MIPYPHFVRRGWDRGSGPIESQWKTATAWVNGRGRWWHSNDAEEMLPLAALHKSCFWEQSWQTRTPLPTPRRHEILPGTIFYENLHLPIGYTTIKVVSPVER